MPNSEQINKAVEYLREQGFALVIPDGHMTLGNKMLLEEVAVRLAEYATLERAEARREAMELLLYVRHLIGCPHSHGWMKDDCNCGLAALRSKLAAPSVEQGSER